MARVLIVDDNRDALELMTELLDRQRSAALGFAAHLVKPIRLDELSAVMQRLV